MKNEFKKFKYVVVIALFAIVLGIVGCFWLSKNAINLYFVEADAEATYIKKFASENEAVYDYVIKYSSKVIENAAKNLAYLLREGTNGESITRDELLELSKDAEADNIIVVDRNGNFVTSTKENYFDFKDMAYDTLRNVFDGDKKTELLTLENNGVTDYYFAAKINDNFEIIIYCDGRNIEGDSNYIMSWDNLLLDKDVSNSFDYFIIEKDSDKVIYNSNDEYVGNNLSVKNNIIDYNGYELVKIFDKWGFIKYFPLENNVLAVFVYLDAVMSRPISYMFFTLVVFLICTIFIAIYSIVVSEEANLIKEGFSDTADTTKYEKIRRRKIHIITLMAIVVMALTMLFFGNVYSISVADEDTTYYYNKVRNLAERSKYHIEELNLMCDNYCKINNDFVGTVLQKNPSKINREDLNKIVKSLEMSEIRILDLNGETICTSNGLDKYKLSSDKEDASYKCWDLLKEDNFIMLPVNYDARGNIYQYACSTLRDSDMNISGIVMSKYDMSEKQEVEKMLDWYEYLKNALKEESIFYFMIDKTNDEYIDAAVSDLIGQNVDDGALPIEATQGGFQGFMGYKGEKLFGKTIQIEKIVTGMFESLGMINSFITAYILMLILFVIVLLLIYMFIIDSFSKHHVLERETLDIENSKTFSIKKIFVTDWSRITGSQKISLLISYLFVVLMIIFSIILLFGEKIFGKNSIINYIINGNWHHSLNVLAFSKCILIISFILLVALIINKLLRFLSNSFDSRGVTICRLLANFVRYVAIFVALYQCLSLVGVDAKTLVASAGILSLVIGFGANKLIQEVVSGLFIIFEGSFQVGDTISIGGGFTGVVKEIGIRNTKVASLDGNVMIVSNSNLDSVVNHSTAKTLIVYEYKIPKAITLDECDKFFNGKLDYLKEKLGDIVKEIKYDGIVAYEIETYTIRFSISCIEESKAKIEYKIDGEMKHLINELSNRIK